MRRGHTPAMTIATLVVLSVGCRSQQRSFNGTVVDPPQQAPVLSGTNWNGEPFDLARLRGKVSIVFFGYTFCPDVCPFSLAKMKQLSAKLGERASDLAVVFVSVDPKRDTVEKLARYVPNFDDRFYGVRPGDLEATRDAFDITIEYGPAQDGPGTDSFYYVDHTGTFYVVDREGMLRLTFPPKATVEDMLPDIEQLLG